MIKRKLKLCAYCGRDKIIFKNAQKGAQCLNCYKYERFKNYGKKPKKTDMDYEQKLIDEADKKFSMIVRRLKAIRSDNGTEQTLLVKCYTCDIILPFTNMECGHYKSRRHMNTRWLIDNCRPQCKTCNREKDGNLEEFERRLENDIPGITSKLNELSKVIYKPTVSDLELLLTTLVTELKLAIRR